MMKHLIAVATIAALAAPVLAQTPTTQTPTTDAKPMIEEAFAKHDVDKSGALSLTEVQAIEKKVMPADFDKYDTDKNKSLTLAEFSKWVEATMTPPASKPG